MSEPGQRTDDVAAMPAGYAEWLVEVKARVRATQFRAVRAANREVIGLYWSIGRDLLDRQDRQGWGAKVVERASADLRREFPDQRGWSPRNLRYMRRLAQGWPTLDAIVQQAAAQLPWGHIQVLLDKLSDQADRDWYAGQAVAGGWSRAVLSLQIDTRLRDRAGAAPSNFDRTLEGADSDLAQALTKDPYVFENLAPTTPGRRCPAPKSSRRSSATSWRTSVRSRPRTTPTVPRATPTVRDRVSCLVTGSRRPSAQLCSKLLRHWPTRCELLSLHLADYRQRALGKLQARSVQERDEALECHVFDRLRHDRAGESEVLAHEVRAPVSWEKARLHLFDHIVVPATVSAKIDLEPTVKLKHAALDAVAHAPERHRERTVLP